MLKNQNEKLSEVEKTYKFTSSSPAIKLSPVELIALWDKTPPMSSKNQNIYRLDPAEALIKLSDYNKKTQHGWIIQPVDLEHVPMEIDINSLIAIHWMNGENRVKTTKKDSKTFVAVVTRVENTLSDENIKKNTILQNKSLEKQTYSSIWSKKERKGFKKS